MKKSFRQIIALVGAILLMGMYLLTLVTALLDRSAGQAWLKASITVTILVPVLLYAILLVERGLREQKDTEQGKKQEQQQEKKK